VTAEKIRRTVVVFPVPGEPRRERSRPGWRAGGCPGEFLGLGVAVVEVVGNERGLEGVRVAEEGLVAAEKGETCHRRGWRRGDC